MRSPQDHRQSLASNLGLWMLSLALSSGEILIGLRTVTSHLVNRTAAVMLLVITLTCRRDILA